VLEIVAGYARGNVCKLSNPEFVGRDVIFVGKPENILSRAGQSGQEEAEEMHDTQ
jgi:hypothetical protein